MEEKVDEYRRLIYFKSIYNNIMTYENENILTSSFFIPWIFFSCHTALAKNTNTVLHRYETSVYFCLLPDCCGTALNFLS